MRESCRVDFFLRGAFWCFAAEAYNLAQSQAADVRHFDRLDSLVEELTRTNAREHEALARQIAQEIAKLSEDARFLNQVRELIRFVKTA